MLPIFCSMLRGGAASGRDDSQIEVWGPVIFEELCHATGDSERALRARVRSAGGGPPPGAVTGRDWSEELAAHSTPVDIAGLEAIGAFSVDDRLSVGEHGKRYVVKVRPGVWHAYSRWDEADDGDYRRAMIHAGTEVVMERGVKLNLQDDGYGVARVAKEDGEVVLVSVEFP